MSPPTEKLNDLLPLSPDQNAERLAALKKLFPDLFTNEGRLNVDELKKVVDPALVSETERYDFRWYGKAKSKREAFTPSRAALVYDPARSVNPEKAGGNMIIEGENLEVLKLLSSAYRERIKCIYIDPPYNTGKDFVYSDNYAEGRKPYWEQTGVTEEGVHVDTNTESDGRFHSNWLSMMHSRLLVARYLLTQDGTIFVSIDDTEAHSLRRLMDEVFGEENFLACVVWEKVFAPKPAAKTFSTSHDYILVYARDIESWTRYLLPRTKEQDERYENPDNDPRGPWASDNLLRNEHRDNSVYSIVAPSGKSWTPKQGTSWRHPEDEMRRLIENNEIWFGADGNGMPRRKKFLTDVQQGLVPETLWAHSQVGHTQDAKRVIIDLFGFDIFDTPKPPALLEHAFRLCTTGDDLVLDFFAGSGTAGQAVTELNKSDDGKRRFILVQLPERIAEESPARKAGFKRISDITIERNKRVIARFKKEAEGTLPNAPEREFADSLGFKVYKLAKSAFPRVEFAPDPEKSEAENIELLKRYIVEKEKTFHIQWDKETVIDEVLLKNGFMLDYALTPRPEFTENEVFLAKDAYKESLICLDQVIAPETVDYFKHHPEHFFICLELALDTTKKWNLKHRLGEKLKAM